MPFDKDKKINTRSFCFIDDVDHIYEILNESQEMLCNLMAEQIDQFAWIQWTLEEHRE